jgi:hypothetical protein
MRSLKARFGERSAHRRASRSERRQRRAILGDRHHQVEHRHDHDKFMGGGGGG